MCNAILLQRRDLISWLLSLFCFLVDICREVLTVFFRRICHLNHWFQWKTYQNSLEFTYFLVMRKKYKFEIRNLEVLFPYQSIYVFPLQNFESRQSYNYRNNINMKALDEFLNIIVMKIMYQKYNNTIQKCFADVHQFSLKIKMKSTFIVQLSGIIFERSKFFELIDWNYRDQSLINS